MPYLEDVKPRSEFAIKWQPHNKCQVIETRIIGGTRHAVGCVSIGAEHRCNKYIGSRVGGLTLIDGRVIESQLASKYERAMNQILGEVCK